MKLKLLIAVSLFVCLGCSNDSAPDTVSPAAYFDNTGRTDVLGGGARMFL